MDQLTWITDYGLWGLGVAAFLGATLVPVSSEVAVVAALKMGLPPWQVFISASIGNALGASLNYILGWLFSGRIEERLQAGKAGRKALRWTQKYGKWSLLGSWLPIVGDPLCLAAGLFRVDFLFFVLVGIGTRVTRYGVLLQIF
jgi:membrane protein YqaA with SNARE-associated domain